MPLVNFRKKFRLVSFEVRSSNIYAVTEHTRNQIFLERYSKKIFFKIFTMILFKAVSETTNRQIESVNRERESVATLLFFGIHYRISLSTISFEFRTISVSVSPLIFLQRYRSSPIEIER